LQNTGVIHFISYQLSPDLTDFHIYIHAYTHRKNLQKAEKDLQQCNQENDLLKQRLSLLSESSHGMASAQEAKSQLQEMTDKLRSQMEELQKKGGGASELRKQLTGGFVTPDYGGISVLTRVMP
jgi:hypothetical protein